MTPTLLDGCSTRPDDYITHNATKPLSYITGGDLSDTEFSSTLCKLTLMCKFGGITL